MARIPDRNADKTAISPTNVLPEEVGALTIMLWPSAYPRIKGARLNVREYFAMPQRCNCSTSWAFTPGPVALATSIPCSSADATSRFGARWCGRPDLNRHRPCGPTDFHTTSAFAAADSAFVVWTIPSPWRRRVRCCPSSLYTFPDSLGLGSGLPCERFPRI